MLLLVEAIRPFEYLQSVDLAALQAVDTYLKSLQRFIWTQLVMLSCAFLSASEGGEADGYHYPRKSSIMLQTP
jgi:hypothetical protein